MSFFSPLARFATALATPVVLSVLVAALTGCVSGSPDTPVRLPSRSDVTIGIKPPTPPCTSFITWRAGTTFAGKVITNQAIADGDAACSVGQGEAAAQLYQRAAGAPLSPSDARELTVRRAAIALGRGAASDALKNLSQFQRKFPTTEVLPDFGFLLGAAYAGSGDIDQAISWWSKVYVAQNGASSFATRSKDATFQLLRRVDDASLERTQEIWRDDDMVRTALAQARANRITPEQMQNQLAAVSLPQPSSVTGDNLGALLPLTGRFQGLGERAKRGVELALSTQASPITLVSVDSGESATLVQQKLSELSKGGVWAIIGPLLAEQVDDVAMSAAENVVVLSLSKRSPTVDGGNFLTLGITAESQINSILDHSRNVIGVTQMAVVGSNEAMQAFGELVRVGMRDRAISLVLERTFLKEDIAMATDIGGDIAASKAQAVLFLDNAGVAGTIAAGIPEADRLNIKLLGLAAWDNESQLQQSRAVLDGARFVSGFPRSSSREVVRNFVATYQQRYREMPDLVAAQGFDAASLILAAQSRMPPGGSLLAAIQSLPPYLGLTGRIENQAGNVVRTLAVLEFRNGQVTEIQ